MISISKNDAKLPGKPDIVLPKYKNGHLCEWLPIQDLLLDVECYHKTEIEYPSRMDQVQIAD